MLRIYDENPIIQSFIRLVKTESDFIVRSVKADLGRLTLVVTVIIVDAYPFFSDLP